MIVRASAGGCAAPLPVLPCRANFVGFCLNWTTRPIPTSSRVSRRPSAAHQGLAVDLGTGTRARRRHGIDPRAPSGLRQLGREVANQEADLACLQVEVVAAAA